MSKTLLIDWFDQLLFGHRRQIILEPPSTLYELICRLEVDGIDWRDMIRHGGLTMFRYQVNGDLEKLLDYFENVYLQDRTDTPLPKFHTRSITHLFNQLLAIMARRDQIQSHHLALGTEDDKAILQRILSKPDDSNFFHYNSAQFWGELARVYLTHRRPLPKELCPLPGSENVNKMQRLYNVTSQTYGYDFDPMSMYMVPASDHVNAVHWKSDTLLEAFLHTHPKHELSRSVQQLVVRAINQFLSGQHPSCLKEKNASITTFLENVKVIHDSVPKASLMAKSPPLVIDIFQRLLALSQLDDLWHSVSLDDPVDQKATDLMLLTEKLYLADRQNHILLKHISPD